MALKLYPVGIQTFERIRKENKLYIDKIGIYLSNDTFWWMLFLLKSSTPFR